MDWSWEKTDRRLFLNLALSHAPHLSFKKHAFLADLWVNIIYHTVTFNKMVTLFLNLLQSDKVLKSFEKDIFSEREPRKRQVFLRSKKEVYGPLSI